MVAGLFRNAGYFMGDKLHEPRHSNPLGFFEDAAVNNINESILAPLIPAAVRQDGIVYQADAPGPGQRWLARLPPDTAIKATAEQLEVVSGLTNHQPFCFKDPRFAYTLHLWRPSGGDCRFICVFRNPSEVIESILKECRTVDYLRNFSISVAQAAEVWFYNYRSIRQNHANTGEWFFIEYDQVFEPNVLERLAAFTGAELDRNFPTGTLKRSKPSYKIGPAMQSLYDELRQRAQLSLDTVF
jgi:hypothetical protein